MYGRRRDRIVELDVGGHQEASRSEVNGLQEIDRLDRGGLGDSCSDEPDSSSGVVLDLPLKNGRIFEYDDRELVPDAGTSRPTGVSWQAIMRSGWPEIGSEPGTAIVSARFR